MIDEKYRRLSQPPPRALKKITGGRLKGMSDINPQWRYEAMTEVYGLCGIGWKFEVVRKWTEPGPDGQVFAFADINLYVAIDGKWSEPIPGNGGNMLVTKEKAGLYASDEAFKMAITDALSTAMKMIGVGADVYAGLWDGSKYNRIEQPHEGVTEPRLTALKKAWATKHAEVLGDAGKDEQRRLFAQWVQQTLGSEFDINVNDFGGWSTEDMKQCDEAVKAAPEQ